MDGPPPLVNWSALPGLISGAWYMYWTRSVNTPSSSGGDVGVSMSNHCSMSMMLCDRCWIEPLSKYWPALAVVRRDDALPANVQIAAGPAALVCWSRKPIHIGESGWMKLAKGKLFCVAMDLGRPCCTNMALLEVNFSRPAKAGDRTGTPRSELLALR